MPLDNGRIGEGIICKEHGTTIGRHEKLIAEMAEKVNMIPAMHQLLVDLKSYVYGAGTKDHPGFGIRTDRLEVWRDHHERYHAKWGIRGWAVFMLLLTNLGALLATVKLFIQYISMSRGG